jgi:ABC-type antimicrobial peptide transport system permease subunit
MGIYGVMAYTVGQRTPEIGLRMALGAEGRDVLRLVLRQGCRLALTGMAIGFIAAFLLAHLLERLLFDISPHDPPIFTAVPLLLGLVAVAACLLPAWRASRIPPMAALRYE